MKVGDLVKQIYTNRLYRVCALKCDVCGEVIVAWETKDEFTVTECQPKECLVVFKEKIK